MIYSQAQLEEVEDEEVDDELVVVGIEVSEDIDGPIQAGRKFENFPNPSQVFTAGQKYVVLAPDSGLPALYNDPRIEVYHDPEGIAKCFLAGNYLSPDVFGWDGKKELHQKVCEQLGITSQGLDQDEYYRAELRAIAGEDDPEVEEEVETTKKQMYIDEYKYTELKSMASDAGIPNANVKKDELAEWMAENYDQNEETEESEE